MNDQPLHDGTERLVQDGMSGGTIDFSVDDGFATATESGSRRRIDAGTLLFAGIVVASIVGLWSMRTLGRSSAANITNGETVRDVREWVWSRSDEKMSASLGGLELIGRLDKDQLNTLQVPADELSNQAPFQYFHESRHEVEVVKTAKPTEVDPRNRLRDQWQQLIDEIGSQMAVTAIVASDTPRAQAVLNGHRIMVGDLFQVVHMGDEYAFAVERIGPHGVVLHAVNRSIEHEHRIQIGVDRGW